MPDAMPDAGPDIGPDTGPEPVHEGSRRAVVGTMGRMSGPQVVDVELDRTVALRVTYDDGVTATFPIGSLRDACPCAGCRGRREADLAVTTADDVHARDAELHGNWGISIRWSDGHDTGIYAWQNLRAWWDAHQHATDSTDAADADADERTVD
jgi:DUF971 family protein